MIRKDLTQDADRPHFYSQFWLDVAAGKPHSHAAVGASVPEGEDAEDADLDALLATPVARVEPKPKTKAPEKKEPARALTSLADLANIELLMRNSAELGDDAVPDIEAADQPAAEPQAITAFDGDERAGQPGEAADEEPASIEAIAEEEPDYDANGFDEDEDEDEWGGGRKPKPKRPPRRERRPF